MDFFLELFGSLPRAGPGSNDLTRKAFEMIPSLPDSPRILDVGCGPGMQTLELLKLSSGHVVALDIFPDMINRLNAAANSACVSARLESIVQDMEKMIFPPSSFDVIWSEGAIYILGFERGLKRFRELVKPGGYVGVSEAVWLKPGPPADVVDFWREYPEIDTVAAKLDVVESCGYEVIGHFVFPVSAWTDQYYDPLEKLIADKSQDWRDIPEAEAILREAKNEISLFRRYWDYYSYAFFVLRR